MKPDFAFHLSADGIRLAHRTAEGWEEIGSVQPEDPDLAAKLADLRAVAEDRASGAFATKIVLPADLVRFGKIDSREATESDIRAALDGATPYNPTELALDWVRVGDQTLFAAVHRDHLREAESFAEAQGMSAVCLTATPPPFAFDGEAFFGRTHAADRILGPQTAVDPDGRPAKGKLKATEAVEPPKAAFASRRGGDETTDADAKAEADATETDEAMSEEADAPTLDDLPVEDGDALDETAPDGARLDDEHAEADAPGEDLPEEPHVAAFASIRDRAITSDNPTGPLERAVAAQIPADVPPDDPALVLISEQSDGNIALRAQQGFFAEEREPGLVERLSNALRPVGQTIGGAAAGTAAAVSERLAALREARDARAEAREEERAARLAAMPEPEPEPAPEPEAQPDPLPEPVATRPTLAGSSRFLSIRNRPLAADTEGHTGSAPSARSTLTARRTERDLEAERMTVFGARGQSPSAFDGELRRTVTIAASVVLLLTIGTVSALGSIWNIGPLAPVFDTLRVALAPAEEDTPFVSIADEAAADAGFDVGEPVLETATAPEATPTVDTAPIDTAPEVAFEAPADAVLGDADTPAGLPDTADAPVVTEAPQVEPDAPTEDGTAAVVQPAPNTDLAASGGTAAPLGRVLSPDEAEAIYATTGVWQRAPRVPLQPRGGSVNEVFIADLDAAMVGREAISLPTGLALRTDPVPASLLNPPPADAIFVRDDRGFVEATADGALTPEGVVVFLGRPDSIPGDRPIRTPEVETLISPEEPAVEPSALAAVRPQARTNLIEPAQAVPDTPADNDRLEAIRPLLRPAGLFAPTPAAPADAIALALEGIAAEDAALAAERIAAASDLALGNSPRPETRPAAFAGLTQAPPRSIPNAAAASTAGILSDEPAPLVLAPGGTTEASGPVTNTVAQQATIEDGINLRQVSLIGVYGTPNARRALVRLANGRLIKVELGDSLDGGRVSAIGESDLQYQRNGRAITLTVASG